MAKNIRQFPGADAPDAPISTGKCVIQLKSDWAFSKCNKVNSATVETYSATLKPTEYIQLLTRNIERNSETSRIFSKATFCIFVVDLVNAVIKVD